jgi:hypothetical protein
MRTKYLDQLQELIARAARDAVFRDSLVNAPAVAKDHTTDVAEAVEIVESIKRALRRFGGNPDLHEEDANSWAVGVLARSGAAENDRWKINVVGSHALHETWDVLKSHPAHHKPKKKKKTKWGDVKKAPQKSTNKATGKHK